LIHSHFSFLSHHHQHSLSPIHHLFLAVFLFCVVESAVWFSVYSDLNRTGEPFCCPYPSQVVTAMSMQVGTMLI
jgi:hypothetical protein